VSGDAFRIEIRDRVYTSRSEAAHALGAWAHQRGLQYSNPIPAPERIGTIGGHVITAHTERQYTAATGGKTMLRLSLEDAPGMGITVDPAEVLRNNVGTMVQLANRVDGIPSAITDRERRVAEARETVVQAEARLGAPFVHAAQLEEAYARVKRVDQAMREQSGPPSPAPERPVVDGAPEAVVASARDASRASLSARINGRVAALRQRDGDESAAGRDSFERDGRTR